MANQSKIASIFDWAFNPHKDHAKHKGWSHPIFSLGLMAMSSLSLCSYIANKLAKQDPKLIHKIPDSTRLKTTIFLAGYWIVMLLSRLVHHRTKAIYDMLWACNVSILLAIFGLIKNNPTLIGASIITVACDQLLWYVDILSYVLTGKFHIGVAAYLKWPETTLIHKLTSTHHLWFIPILANILKKAGGLTPESFKVSYGLTVILWIVARAVLPKTLATHDGTETYMNVNLSWELWKDIKFDLISKFLKDASYLRCLATSSGVWNGLNFLSYLLLKTMV